MGCVKKIEGYKMYLRPNKPGISKELVDKGGREFAFMWLLREESKGFSYGCDVGANIGYTTIPLAKNCDFVFAFEPDKRSRRLLKRSIAMNNLVGPDGNVAVYACVISGKNGWVKFIESKKPNQSRVSSKDGSKYYAITLDYHFGRSEKANDLFIKMDVEGHETKIIEGAMETLRRMKRCKILMEIHPDKYTSEEFDGMFRFLDNERFKVKYVINAKGKMDVFEKNGYKPFKRFGDYSRAVYKDININHVVDWSSHLDTDKKKIIRALMWEKK